MRPHFHAIVTFGTSFLLITASIAAGLEDPAKPASGSRKVDFHKDVRPILSQHCFQCHGPDDGARKGKLRLDRKDDAFAERKEKHVVAPGKLDDSLVWDRITTDNEKKRMPPEGKAEPLTEKKIEIIKLWIEQGADWKEHWSFVAPVKPAAPEVKDKNWARDPIDNFILSHLEKEGLKPEAEATKEAWLRRASFDLTGLPPTPAEIDAFLKDTNPNAYEKQADRLLASTRYGERQAQEWLDLARYADTNGYQNDNPRKAWKWREWVINAYNANMPYDQFTIEQLAGDLLPNATLSQKVATGFNRNHPVNSEAGEEEDEYRSAYVIDRVNTTATTFMGLTLACAQCHDHKYDPLTQKDYYSFYSFFNNIKERDSDFRNPRPSIPVPNPDQEPKLKDIQTRVKALEDRLKQEDPIADANQKSWEKLTLERLGEPIAWTVAEPAGMLSRNGSLLKKLEDGSILSSGPTPVKDTYDIVLQPGKKKIAALRIEVLPHDSQPEKAVGRATDGRFILSALEVRNSTTSDSTEPPLVYISRADADLNQKPREDMSGYDMTPGPVEGAIVTEPVGGGGEGMFGMGGGRGFGWSIVEDERLKPHEAVILPIETLELNDASVLRISMHHSSSMKFKSLIGRFRISYTEDERARTLLMPAQTKLWSTIGPFAAEDTAKAYETAFEPEKDLLKGAALDLKKSYEKVVLAGAEAAKGGGPGGGFNKFGGGAPAAAPPAEANKADDNKPEPPKANDKNDKVEKTEKPAEDAKGETVKSEKAAKDKEKEGEPAAAKETTKVETPTDGANDHEKFAGEKPSEEKPAGGEKPKGPGGGFKKGNFNGGGKFGKKPPMEGEAAAADDKNADAKKNDDAKKDDTKKEDVNKDGAEPAEGPKGGKGKNSEKLASASPKESAGGDAKNEKPSEKTAEKKDSEKADKKEDKKADEKPAEPKKKAEKVAWVEQLKWRDGSSGRIEGAANSAYYLTRKIVSTKPRTAMVKIDGPAGAKVWLNGEPIYSVAPPPAPAAPAGMPGMTKKEEGPAAAAEKPAAADAKKDEKDKDKKDTKKDAKKDDKDKKDEDEGPEMNFDFDDFDFATGRMRGSKEEKKFRMGLREGENEIVVKVVYAGGGGGGGRNMFFFGGDGGGGPRMGGGGGSFTFDFTPEGDDVINYEVACALRMLATDVAQAEKANVTKPADAPAVQPAPGAGDAAGSGGKGDSGNGNSNNSSNGAAGNGTSGNSTNGNGKGSGRAVAITTIEGGDDKTVAKDDDTKKHVTKLPEPAAAPAPQDKADEKKVSLVGEQSAPLASYEQTGPVLTAPERRKVVLRDYYRAKIDPIGRVLNEELQKLKDEERQIKKEIPETLVMEERDKNPRQAYIFKRGLYKNKGENVTTNTPGALPAMAADLPKNRLGLAKWLVSKEHPLTARVAVNRIWQQYFGVGIVRSAEDFGIRCEQPMNPELLDYLACEFMDGWDMKKLHKRIVLSASYRQSSNITKEKMEKDPENRLLSRGPRLRLSAEMVRDNALAASGLLYEKIGGESVKPYQPKNAWKTVDGNNNSSYKRDKDEKQYRRGLYVYWKRGSPYPSMLNFDAAKRENCTVTRAYTTTPLQALTLLNDPVYVECAKMLGQRMLKDKEVGREKDDTKRLVYGFRLCTSRKPTDQELDILKKHLTEQRDYYKSEPELAKKFIGVGDAKVDEKIDAVEAAAWASVGSVLLNLDATIRRG